MLHQPCQERGRSEPVRGKRAMKSGPSPHRRNARRSPQMTTRAALRVGLNCGLRSRKAPFVALSPSAGASQAKLCHAQAEGLQIPAWKMSDVELEGADIPMLLLMRLIRKAAPVLVFAAALAAGGIAFASLGQPSPWQMGFQQSAAPTMDDIIWFHDFVLWIIAGITAFVLVLLVLVIVKFNARANPTPSRTTHNTLIEVAWTVIPVIILVAIAIPSFRILFVQLNTPPSDLTIKATGNQWNWTYTYPDAKIEFTSIMLTDADRAKQNPAPPRLLGVDNPIVVPVNKVVRVNTTGSDVIHAFAVPSFGVKMDA